MEEFSGQHSLAHELAVALMPEPSAGSKLLAEEFGLEYDEGAEGIDEEAMMIVDEDAPERVAEPEQPERYTEQDAMQVLANDLESTDNFLAHLRSIDVDGLSQQPSLEHIAAEVIRRLNESTKDREEQVRELLEYEREFRKIAGEVGGGEVLAQLEELVQMDDLVQSPVTHTEDDESQPWDDDDEVSIKDSFSQLKGPPTPATTIPQLAHLRSFTTSLVTSLTTISEHAQVNGAATTDAGRKIRALKNRLGDWRTEWNSAEQSRLKIEKWEATGHAIRADGRDVVQEHIQAFERALADAATKTQAIMAAS